ncbi:MAG TPA: YicC/YloC family endoribonuclease [Xanthobacteraceae bacterium]|nr:YicC/YloC family endoribonuclease [Xanthobacteraceae bacterium]
MTLSSMTGFARSHGVSGPYSWTWEIKSVNSKGLDIRLRLPPGWDAIEPIVRARASEAVTRGALQATLMVERTGVAPIVRINEPVLAAVLETLKRVGAQVNADPPRLDGILAIKGVVEVAEAQESEDERRAAEVAAVAGFGAALQSLAEMRQHEGAALGKILNGRLDEIAGLAARADAAPGRKADAIRQRLSEQIAVLMESGRFDQDRLYQEALLLASKADIREELDRLSAHVAQARKLLSSGGAIGRRLDFLSQELNRESNTLCAKSNDTELTTTGLELKTVVEQFREQVQNLE